MRMIPIAKRVEKLMPITVSVFRVEWDRMYSIRQFVKIPALIAPKNIGIVPRDWVSKKAITIPGKIEWLIASPIRARRLNIRKFPTRPQLSDARKPISTIQKLSSAWPVAQGPVKKLYRLKSGMKDRCIKYL
jgi:hypothetical protein